MHLVPPPPPSSPFAKGGQEADLKSRLSCLPQIPPHPPFAKGGQGFTLLELLVALAIASVMLGIVTLNLMPTAQSKLRDESKRLAFLMENGALASQAGGQPLAWSGTGNSYRFWKRTKEGEWVRIEQDKLLRPRTLPEAVFIDTVTFDGRRIEPGALVMLSPELAARTFRIDLKSGGHFATVNGDGLGKIHVEEGQLP